MTTETLERKAVDCRVKCMGDGCDGAGDFSVYAAEWSIDRANERIDRAAFKNLPDFVRDGFFGLSHRYDLLPIGTIDSAHPDSYGLLVSGKFHSTPEAQAARTVMRERLDRGKGVKLSIGYQVTSDAHLTENGKSYRLLKGINLLECSLVAVPANVGAYAVSVKGITSIKEGRTLSNATRRRLRAALDGITSLMVDLQALLDENEPTGKGRRAGTGGIEQVFREHADHLRAVRRREQAEFDRLCRGATTAARLRLKVERMASRPR
jgi:HK97 family phage prohead protease